MLNKKVAILQGVLFFFAATVRADFLETERFKSPGGKIEIIFQKLEHRKFSAEDFRRNFDNVNHVEYAIEFQRAGDKKIIASAKYADVYGWTEEAKPTPPETIFQDFIWSPKEDFVILPPSAWASAPGTESGLAVALDPKYAWGSAEVPLDNGVWVDDLRMVGDTHSDCEYSVNLFDGRTGRISPIKPAQSPVGYEIKSTRGRNILIQKVLDNCRSEDDLKKFVPECFSLNPDTLKTKPAACPE